MEPAETLLKYFDYGHLPEHLQAASKIFARAAEEVVGFIPAGPERTVAMRKLLEAKDCAVRACLTGAEDPPAGRTKLR